MSDFCVAYEHCRGFDPTTRTPAPTWGNPLCEDCLRACHHVVAVLLIYDYVDLEQHIGPSTGTGEHVSGTREAPIPLSLGIEALQRQIWLLTTTWEQVLRDVDSLAEPQGRVRDGYAVQRAITIIEPRIERLAKIPLTDVMPEGPDAPPEPHSGAEGLLAMASLHGRVRAALGLTRLVHSIPGECSCCGLPALRRDDGTDTVYCAGCYAWMTIDEYARYATMAVAEHKFRTKVKR